MDSAAFNEWISGKRLGIGPAVVRLLLRAASLFYGLAVGVRQAAFASGWMRQRRAPVPVVSLGNLTAGGTGKTPFAAYVAQWFGGQGVRVCFLSRGYGAAAAGAVNDEALVLEKLCPGVPHVQQADRVAGARRAVAEFGCQLLILDDGFQHRRLARDLDIVLVDALNPWGYGYLLPRGLLREPVGALRRAGLVVITRVDQASVGQLAEIRRRIVAVAPACAIVETAFPAERFVNAGGASEPLAMLRGRPVAAFCGIGNPDAFRDSLARLELNVVAFRAFPDHHAYQPADIEHLMRWASAENVAAVITTQKDLVKLQCDRLGELPLWAVQIGTRIVRGEQALAGRLRDVARIADCGLRIPD